MDVLKLPTDNLYIFLTIGGLFTFIFFVNKLLTSFNTIKSKISKTHKEVSLVEIDVKELASQFEFQKNVIEMLIDAFEKKYNVKFESPNENKATTKQKRFTIPETIEKNLISDFIFDYEKISEYLSKLGEDTIRQEKAVSNLKNDNNEIKTLNSELKQQFTIYLLIIFFSLIITIVGFFAWYSKNQKYQDSIIKAQYEQLISKKTKKQSIL